MVDDRLIHLVFGGYGVGDEHAALQVHGTLCAEGVGDSRGCIEPVIDPEARLAGIEGRQFVGTEADDGYAFGLEVFECQTDVENGFAAGANDHDGCHGEFFEVGADVHGRFCTAVNAAYATGGKDLNARHMGYDHGGGDGGSAVAALCHEYG